MSEIKLPFVVIGHGEGLETILKAVPANRLLPTVQDAIDRGVTSICIELMTPDKVLDMIRRMAEDGENDHE